MSDPEQEQSTARALLEHLDRLNRAQQAPPEVFRPEEIDQVRAILEHSDTLIEIAEYEDAKGLLWSRYRAILIGLAAVCGAIAALGSYIEEALRWLLRWLS